MKSVFLAGALALTLLSNPAHADDGLTLPIDLAAAALSPNQYLWTDTASGEPLSVVVSIADQRAYVYRGDVLVAVSTVSTGKDGNETPAGTYPILQKKAVHHSNLYDDAPMPFMQRLTWDGIAIHAGKNPGFPASHGCIRVPTAFAKKLFDATQMGTTVTVVDESVDPSMPPPPPLPAADAGDVAAANADQIAAR
ncbi:MAG TPA: L,D-transpeptidase family protein [Sphingomonas sp.]|jgi:lipoprotein-anchoring transpeptidase ErfK/SrfK